MIVTINVAVLLAIIIVVRLRRRTHARSRFDEKMTGHLPHVRGADRTDRVREVDPGRRHPARGRPLEGRPMTQA
uniref:Uncharacterized protein n=1 Tax=Streptomyces sp. FR1 TaxID=349971 RepID=V9Z2I3_9ACTN|nr:Hypothetical protein pFRL2_97 [Streptomyces sp. FR1]